MTPKFPDFHRRHPERFFAAWDVGVREMLYVVVAYHQLAREQAGGHVTDPLRPLFTDDEIRDAMTARREAVRLYERLAATPGGHAGDMLLRAEVAWQFAQCLYARVPTTRRTRPPPLR